MTHQSFVNWRLREMYAHPGMWASTRESFGFQLAMLVEVHELYEDKKTPQHVVLSRLFGPGNTVSQEPLDDEWARERVTMLRKMLESD
jgi:hypothetical protein